MKYISSLNKETIKKFIRSQGFEFDDENFEYDKENSAVFVRRARGKTEEEKDEILTSVLSSSIPLLMASLMIGGSYASNQVGLLLTDYYSAIIDVCFDEEAENRKKEFNNNWVSFLFNTFGDDYIIDYENYYKEKEKEEQNNNDDFKF